MARKCARTELRHGFAGFWFARAAPGSQPLQLSTSAAVAFHALRVLGKADFGFSSSATEVNSADPTITSHSGPIMQMRGGFSPTLFFFRVLKQIIFRLWVLPKMKEPLGEVRKRLSTCRIHQPRFSFFRGGSCRFAPMIGEGSPSIS